MEDEATYTIDEDKRREQAEYIKKVLLSAGKSETAIEAITKLDEAANKLFEMTHDRAEFIHVLGMAISGYIVFYAKNEQDLLLARASFDDSIEEVLFNGRMQRANNMELRKLLSVLGGQR